MSTKPRSSEGCWTCRLRRKKCDETRPVCEGCAALEIECLYSESKPDWMDNGTRQKEMADRLKIKVKNRATWRREKRFLQTIENGTAAINLTAGADGGHIITSIPRAEPVAPSIGPGETTAGTGSDTTSEQHEQQRGPSPSSTLSRASRAQPTPTSSTPPNEFSMNVDASEDFLMPHMSPDVSAVRGNASRLVPLRDARLSSDPRTTATAEATAAVPGPDLTTGFNGMEWPPFEPTLAPPNLEKERDLNFMMLYLDYVFPFLYPFCRPSLLNSGRGWLLVLLMKNKAVFHSALSVSAYFMSVVASEQAEGRHDTCLRHNAEELHKQQELSLRELQQNISDLNRRGGVQGHLAESARALESIIQLLYFEVVISRLDSWYMHLDAALLLFEQIMEHHGVVSTAVNGNSVSGMAGASHVQPTYEYSWRQIMTELSPFKAYFPGLSPPGIIPYSGDQSALRFYISLLLYVDVVVSTTTEQPPRLHKFHTALIRPPPGEPLGEQPEITDTSIGFDPSNVLLNIDEVIGVQNWVILALSEASALAAWKKEAVAAQKLSVSELVGRATPIEMSLRARLACLEARSGEAGWQEAQDNPLPKEPIRTGFFPNYLAQAEEMVGAHMESQLRRGDLEAPHIDKAASLSSDPVSLIWGYATLSYLLVVVNGWQPASDAIRQNADRTLQLIAQLPSAACLRNVSWPFCVTGCLATPEQEPIFRAMVDRICGGQLFGSVNEALRIMEGVWVALRNCCGEHNLVDWDFAKSFNVLGRTPFLM